MAAAILLMWVLLPVLSAKRLINSTGLLGRGQMGEGINACDAGASASGAGAIAYQLIGKHSTLAQDEQNYIRLTLPGPWPNTKLKLKATIRKNNQKHKATHTVEGRFKATLEGNILGIVAYVNFESRAKVTMPDAWLVEDKHGARQIVIPALGVISRTLGRLAMMKLEEKYRQIAQALKRAANAIAEPINRVVTRPLYDKVKALPMEVAGRLFLGRTRAERLRSYRFLKGIMYSAMNTAKPHAYRLLANWFKSQPPRPKPTTTKEYSKTPKAYNLYNTTLEAKSKRLERCQQLLESLPIPRSNGEVEAFGDEEGQAYGGVDADGDPNDFACQEFLQASRQAAVALQFNMMGQCFLDKFEMLDVYFSEDKTHAAFRDCFFLPHDAQDYIQRLGLAKDVDLTPVQNICGGGRLHGMTSAGDLPHWHYKDWNLTNDYCTKAECGPLSVLFDNFETPIDFYRSRLTAVSILCGFVYSIPTVAPKDVSPKILESSIDILRGFIYGSADDEDDEETSLKGNSVYPNDATPERVFEWLSTPPERLQQAHQQVRAYAIADKQTLEISAKAKQVQLMAQAYSDTLKSKYGIGRDQQPIELKACVTAPEGCVNAGHVNLDTKFWVDVGMEINIGKEIKFKFGVGPFLKWSTQSGKIEVKSVFLFNFEFMNMIKLEGRWEGAPGRYGYRDLKVRLYPKVQSLSINGVGTAELQTGLGCSLALTLADVAKLSLAGAATSDSNTGRAVLKTLVVGILSSMHWWWPAGEEALAGVVSQLANELSGLSTIGRDLKQGLRRLLGGLTFASAEVGHGPMLMMEAKWDMSSDGDAKLKDAGVYIGMASQLTVDFGMPNWLSKDLEFKAKSYHGYGLWTNHANDLWRAIHAPK